MREVLVPTLLEMLAWLLFVGVPLVAVILYSSRREPRDEVGERRRLRRIQELAEQEKRRAG